MTTDPHSLYLLARQRGLHMKAEGEKLLVWPRTKVTPEIQTMLREHKSALLAWLRGCADYWRDRLKPDLNLPEDFFRTYAAGHPVVEITSDLRRFPSGPTSARGGSVTAWIAVAGQVNSDEFVGADGSTIEAVFIGLRNIQHTACRAALQRLAAEPACPADVQKAIRKQLA